MSAAIKYLEAAKIEELVTTLTEDGYEILGATNGDEQQYDLTARKNEKRIAVEVVARTTLREAAMVERVSRLRQEAYRQGYDEFRLVIVGPPRETAVSIAGLDGLLLRAMLADPPQALTSLAAHVRITYVGHFEIDAVDVTAAAVRVEGSGVVEVALRDEDFGPREEDWEIDFPFSFSVVLTRDLQLTEVTSLAVDTSSFYYEGDGDLAQ